MRRNIRSCYGAAVIVSLSALFACEFSLDASGRTRTVAVVLSRASTLSPAPKPPFASVIDSLALVITPSSGTPQAMRRRLLPTDIDLNIPVTVPEGSVRFEAAILSLNGITLFDGAVTTIVNTDNFTVNIPLVDRRPVMLLAPDSLLMPPPAVNTTVPIPGTAIFMVHNRGRSSLVWRVSGTDAAFAACQSCSIVPRQDTLLADDSSRVVVSSFRPSGSLISITFFSNEGSITVTARVR